MELTQEIARELLEYKPDTGDLYWKAREDKWFTSAGARARWNSRYAGRPAMTYRCRGHRTGHLLGRLYMAHTVVWIWMTGRRPHAVAPRNGKVDDLRWSNLVECKNAADARDFRRFNEGRMPDALWKTPSGRWAVRFGGRYLGSFNNRTDAIARRHKAASDRWGIPNQPSPGA